LSFGRVAAAVFPAAERTGMAIPRHVVLPATAGEGVCAYSNPVGARRL